VHKQLIIDAVLTTLWPGVLALRPSLWPRHQPRPPAQVQVQPPPRVTSRLDAVVRRLPPTAPHGGALGSRYNLLAAVERSFAHPRRRETRPKRAMECDPSVAGEARV